MKKQYAFIFNLLSGFLASLLLISAAQAQCNFTVAVSPGGPLSVPAAGASHTLTATISTAGFNFNGTGFDAAVEAMLVQADGKLLIGGRFTKYNGADCPDYLARLNADGSLDATFNPAAGQAAWGFDADVDALLQQADGKLLVGGSFGAYNGAASCPDKLVRLNPDGSLDAAFNPGGAGYGRDDTYPSAVLSLALQPNGQVLVGGNYLLYNGRACSQNLTRLNADGSLQENFIARPTSTNAQWGIAGTVAAIAVAADGKLVLGGTLGSYNGDPSCPNGLARLNADGSLDATFNSKGDGFSVGTTGSVYSYNVADLAVQPDGAILAVGSFSKYNGTTCAAGIVRVLPTGLLDASFGGLGIGGDRYYGYSLNSLALQPDGKVVIGGAFATYNGQVSPHDLARLTATGTLDASFNGSGAGFGDTPYLLSNVLAVATQADGRVLVGGQLLSYNGAACAPAFLRTLPDGSLDNQPSPLATPPAYRWSPGGQTTSSISVTQPGSYTVAVTANGCTTQSNTVVIAPPSSCVIAVVADPPGPLTLSGSGGQLLLPTVVAQAFNAGGSGFDAQVQALLALPDGRRLVGGNFTTYNGQACPARLVCLLPDGRLDPSFNPGGVGFDRNVTALLLQPDGNILVGGAFTKYNGNAAAPDALVRLLPDGSLDATFNAGGAGVAGSVAALAWQSGKVLVGGGFVKYNGYFCPNNLLRLNANGSFDDSFNGFSGSRGGFNAPVSCVATLPSGQLLVGGSFSAYNSVACSFGLTRLSAEGVLDATFNTTTASQRGFSSLVYAVVVEPGGTVLVGGAFSTYNGQDCPDGLVRLAPSGALQAFGSGAGFQSSNFAGYVQALALQADGKVLVGGGFDNYSGQVTGGLTRLSAAGVLDATFNGGRGTLGNVVQAILVEPTGNLLAGGSFAPGFIGRVFPDGKRNDSVVLTEDISYRWSPGGQTTPGLYITQPGTYTVTATRGTCVVTSNAVVVSGTGALPAAATCGYVAQVSPAGPVSLSAGASQVLTATVSNPGFNAGGSGFNGTVLATLVQADGRVLVGGGFTRYNDQDCPDYLVRLLADGSLDPTFNPGGTGFQPAGNDAGVFALLQQADGRVLVGGGFSTYDGWNCPDNLVRLNPDGSLDTGFNAGGAGFGGRVYALALRPTGQVLAGGSMYSFNGATCAQGLVQVTAAGQRDAGFSAGTGVSGKSATCSGGVGQVIYALALQADGRLLIGGEFSSYNGSAACPDHFARVTTTGALDATFNPGGTGLDCFAQIILVQPDGKVLVGGAIAFYNGQLAPEGLMRFTANGALDPTFNLGGRGFQGGVSALLLQPDGKLLVGGAYAQFNAATGLPRHLLRVTATGALDPSFNAGGAGFDLLGYALTISALADGRLLVGGLGKSYNGQAGPASLLRLTADGLPSLTPTTPPVTPNYRWSPGGQTTSTLTVTQPGTYFVTATLNGCTAPSNAVLVLAGSAPTLTSLTPGSGPVGTVVTLAGSNLLGATALLLNGQAVGSFVVDAAGTSLTFTVPAGASSGLVSVSTPGGTATSATPFTVTAPQLALAVGAAAYPSGSAYSFGSQVLGSTSSAVSFSLVNAGTAPLALTSVRSTADFALSGPVPTTVPAGGAAAVLVRFTPGALGTRGGVLEVVSALGTYQVLLSGAGTYSAPTASSFSPLSGPPGTVVTVRGTGFAAGSAGVAFNGMSAQAVSVDASGTTLTCTVPAGATAGPLTLTTGGGSAVPPGSFCVHYLATTTGVSRCGAGAATLTGTGLSTAGSYVWYDQATSGSPLVATGPRNEVFTTPSLGQRTTYYVAISTGTGATACEGPRQPVIVTVETGPTATLVASGPLALCPGSTLILTASGAATYRWSTGATVASITVSSAGQYSVVGSSITGCAGPAVALTVGVGTVPPQPTVTVTATSAGTVLTSSSSTGNQWYLNGVAIVGATGPTLTVSSGGQPGSYTVVVSSAAGCASLPSLGQAVALAAAGAVALPTLQVYPNPAHHIVEVVLPSTVAASDVELINARGQLVYQRQVAVATQRLLLDLTGLATGIYLIRIRNATSTLSSRLVVQ